MFKLFIFTHFLNKLINIWLFRKCFIYLYPKSFNTMKQIEPAYITFEQAKLFKEKGEIESKYWYSLDGARYCDEDFANSRGSIPQKFCSAPEQWEVIEWLRVNHNIWISVIKIDGYQDLYYFSITGSNGFNKGYPIEVEEWNDENCDKMGYNNKYLDSPQEAYSAAFDYILKELI